MTQATPTSGGQAAGQSPWSDRVRTSLRGPSLVALTVAGVGLGGFFAWGAVAPLAGAVIAPGAIAAHGVTSIAVTCVAVPPVVASAM